MFKHQGIVYPSVHSVFEARCRQFRVHTTIAVKRTMIIQSKADPSFVMLDRICDIQTNVIKGVKTFDQSPGYLAIETCAQLGAFHIRFSIDFCRHVFLIHVKGFQFHPVETLQGPYLLQGTCLSHSSDAFLYSIQMTKNQCDCYSGQFLFGVSDYNDRFDQDRLKNNYQAIFDNLCDCKFGKKCLKN